jgi:hypothetical protein
MGSMVEWIGWPHCWHLSAGNESSTPHFSQICTTTASVVPA